MWVVVHRQNQWEVTISSLKEDASNVVQRQLPLKGEKRVVQTLSVPQGNTEKPPDTLCPHALSVVTQETGLVFMSLRGCCLS